MIYDIYMALPVFNAPATAAVYGQTLADVELINPEGNTPGTWTWNDSFPARRLEQGHSGKKLSVCLSSGKADLPAIA